MKIFADSTDTNEIKRLIELGLIDGITTNPSLIAKSGRNFWEVITEICRLCEGMPVSAEVVATDFPTMLEQGKKLAALAPNLVVKLPLTQQGLQTCKALTDKNIKTNVTLCFSAPQALFAARAGATYISPFIGRLDDLGQDGCELIEEIREIYDNYAFETQILAASIRSTEHIKRVALAGADCATIPIPLIEEALTHDLTDKGLAAFLADWKNTGQKFV